MDDVHHEERDDVAVLRSDAAGEWLTSDAVLELETWV